MIQLSLARHAKADWAEPGTDDHDRPLTTRGSRDASEVARRVMRTGVRPELVLSSTALRARSTASTFAEVFGVDVVERFELYGADPRALLAVARDSGVREVMLVAHDPGLSDLATALSGEQMRMATSAVAVFTWNDAGWEDVGVRPPDEFSLTSPE